MNKNSNIISILLDSIVLEYNLVICLMGEV